LALTLLLFRQRRESADGLGGHQVDPGKRIPLELTDYIRKQGTTIYPIVGTCRMGEDPMAVVDPRLRVRGLTGLRVIDASIMPAVTTANTNAPTIMIAEKGAAMIREDAATG
jgi:choline dehydrogenase-like flavoprotein